MTEKEFTMFKMFYAYNFLPAIIYFAITESIKLMCDMFSNSEELYQWTIKLPIFNICEVNKQLNSHLSMDFHILVALFTYRICTAFTERRNISNILTTGYDSLLQHCALQYIFLTVRINSVCNWIEFHNG